MSNDNIITFPKKKQSEFCPFLFVETFFEHKRESFFVMGLCENQRRLRLLPFVINAGQEKHRMAIAEKIVTHYSMTGGSLPIWGDIACYKYFISADIAEVFSISGEFIKISNEPNPDAAAVCWKVQEGQDQKKYEIS
jgi:hypothetical protein